MQIVTKMDRSCFSVIVTGTFPEREGVGLREGESQREGRLSDVCYTYDTV